MNNGDYLLGVGLLLLGVGMWAKKRGNRVSHQQITHTSEDMETETRMPRGYRNNNPLNIRISSESWQGKIPLADNTDGVFEQFVNMAYGYRAAMVLIRTYVDKYGCNTLEKIINRWAPANENNTSAYIKQVAQSMGVSPNTYISPNSKAQMTSLVYAMSTVENGRVIMPDKNAIDNGWQLYIY